MNLRNTYFAGHSFRVISGETWYHLPSHRCSFWFLFNLKYIFVSLCMYNSWFWNETFDINFAYQNLMLNLNNLIVKRLKWVA